MRRSTVIAMLALATLTTSCTHRLLDFTIVSSKNFDLSRAGTFTRGTERTSADDTAYIIIFIPTGFPHMKEAVDKAIAKVPGAVALVDGVVYYTSWWFIIGMNSYTIEGTPLIDPQLLPKKSDVEAPPSNYMAAIQDPVTDEMKLVYLTQAEYAQLKEKANSGDYRGAEELLLGR